MNNPEFRNREKRTRLSGKEATNTEAQDYKKTLEKIGELNQQEYQADITDFLNENGFESKPENHEKLTNYISKMKAIFPEYCLYDLTESDLEEVFGKRKRNISNENKKLTQADTNLTQAKSTEQLVDELQAQNVPNTKIIERLLQAHQAGELVLPVQQRQRYSQLLSTLRDTAIGAETTVIADIINNSTANLSSPTAFDHILSEILESDELSAKAKEIIREKFDLKPIVLGADLRDNLILQRARNAKISTEILKLSDQISKIKTMLEMVMRDIKKLKEAIEVETDQNKKPVLTEKLAQKQAFQTALREKIRNQSHDQDAFSKIPTSKTVHVRGCETTVVDDQIEIYIPAQSQHLRFPLESTSGFVAEQINTFLLYNQLKKYGISAEIFGHFDWTDRLLLLPDAVKRTNRFLHFLGMESEATILTQRALKRLDTLMTRLMKPQRFDPKLSPQENAKNRLEKLKMWPINELSMDKLIGRLNLLKYLPFL